MSARSSVAILGLGTSGSGIAADFVLANWRVNGLVTEATSTAVAVSRIEKFVPDRGLLGGAISIHHDIASAVRGVDLVIEALPEDLELKRWAIAEVQSALGGQVIIGTNTSSLTVAAIAHSASSQEQIIGWHYIHPAPAFEVVEVVPGPNTSRDIVRAATRTLRSLGKVPVVLNSDTPGFVFNRLQFALLREATWLVEDGVISARELDLLVRKTLGRRLAAIGPFEAIQLGGKELFRQLANTLFPSLSTQPNWSDQVDLELGLDVSVLLERRQEILGW